MVETLEAVCETVKILKSRKAAAVDLEADSMFHFTEKVCLIQIAVKELVFVIDPLKIPDLSPLKAFFAEPQIMKIFHGADYDIRSLYRDFNITVNNLFDTHLASRYLGYRETGLDAVLNQHFNLQVNKKYQKKDWSQRPLSPNMVEYAAVDAFYLIPLAEILTAELKEKKRLKWVLEACDVLSNVRPAKTNCSPLFLKFKGAGKLSRRRLAVLEKLLQLREKMAKEKDRPLFKIVGNASVMKLVRYLPRTMKQLKKSTALSEKQVGMFGEDILKTISHALEIPEDQLPVYPRNKPPRLAPDVPPRVKALKRWRNAKANLLNIEPAIVATKSVITSIAVKNPASVGELEAVDELKEWQKRRFGEEIIDALKIDDVSLKEKKRNRGATWKK
jgi:ribonuclease D